MSDANKQSVERCKYRHDWQKVVLLLESPQTDYIKCKVCGATPKAKEMQEAEAIIYLRELLKPGDTIYTVLRHVSRSGMSRNIDVYTIKDGAPVWIAGYVGHAIGSPQSQKNWERSQGLTVTGCGMDMGFHVVNSLNYVLYPEYQCIGEKCQAAEHFNNRTPKDGKAIHKDGYALNHKWM